MDKKYRNLRFQNLDDVIRELDSIESAKSLETSGLWSVFQIVIHLSDRMHDSMHGSSYSLPLLVRKTIGRLVKNNMLKDGYMRPGHHNPIAPKKREEGDHKKAISLYRERIQSFREFTGDHPIHSVFDKMTHQEWEKLHSLHAAHHLSFIHPEFGKINEEIQPAKMEESSSSENKKSSAKKQSPKPKLHSKNDDSKKPVLKKAKPVSKKTKSPSKKKSK